jgi:hypothetical protein
MWMPGFVTEIDEIDSSRSRRTRTADLQPKKFSPAGRLRTVFPVTPKSRRVDNCTLRGRSRAPSGTTDIPIANRIWHGRPRHKSRQRLRRRHLAANHRRRFTSGAPRPLRGLTSPSPQSGRRSPSCYDSPACAWRRLTLRRHASAPGRHQPAPSLVQRRLDGLGTLWRPLQVSYS